MANLSIYQDCSRCHGTGSETSGNPPVTVTPCPGCGGVGGIKIGSFPSDNRIDMVLEYLKLIMEVLKVEPK
jgi:hypothetical protein